MKYQGGKTLLSKQISELMLAEVKRPNTPFVSLFCGGLSIENRMGANPNIGRIICNDKHPYLTPMYKAVVEGYELPDSISREEYAHIKDNKNEDRVLTGFVGFAGSFGGKWFGGYASSGSSSKPRNYIDEGKRGLYKKLATLQNAEWLCLDYADVIVPPDAIVYADPPYNNTTGYALGEKFNSKAFWQHMRELSQAANVFISELEAPNDFECIWERKVTRTLNVNKAAQKKAVEKVFKYKGERMSE